MGHISFTPPSEFAIPSDRTVVSDMFTDRRR
jgi:hypothetical protein